MYFFIHKTKKYPTKIGSNNVQVLTDHNLINFVKLKNIQQKMEAIIFKS